MTQKQSFKQLVRARMKKTGERYTTARAHLLAKVAVASDPSLDWASYPGLLDGYRTFGGIQNDTSTLKNALLFAGVTHPATGEPYSEAMLHGLAGGLGFMYAVFEYKGHLPMLTIVMRSRTMPNAYLSEALARVGAEVVQHATTSKKKAQATLDAALAAGRPLLAVVDTGSLPYYGLGAAMEGMAPQHVVVVGRDGDRLWIDDRCVRPVAISVEDLAKGRGRRKASKHAAVEILGSSDAHDWRGALREAIATCIRALADGDVGVPPSFRVNCGFSGMEKWRSLLVDSKSKKGWPHVFAQGPAATQGLSRVYDCLQYDYTAPAGGRALYADFLDEAAVLLEETALQEAARGFRASGALWAEMANAVAKFSDRATARSCSIADERAELLDSQGSDAAATLARLAIEKTEVVASSDVTAASVADLAARLAKTLGQVIEVEREAVDSLRRLT